MIDDYATATHIRSGKPGFVHFAPPLRRRKAEGLPPRQFRVIDQEVSVGEGHVLVRDLAITAEGGTLRYRRYLAAPGPGQVSRSFRRPRFRVECPAARCRSGGPETVSSTPDGPCITGEMLPFGGRPGRLRVADSEAQHVAQETADTKIAFASTPHDVKYSGSSPEVQLRDQPRPIRPLRHGSRRRIIDPRMSRAERGRFLICRSPLRAL